MSRRKPPSMPAHADSMRRQIAAAAARLMAEDGINDYGFAKRKAAKQLGVAEGDTLPGNHEVEAELRAYQALYQADEQPAHLRRLREIAIAAMRRLAEFNPCLTGAVLDGTAGWNADIELDLFADSSKDVEIMLLSHNIPYEIDDIRRPTPNSPETRLRIGLDGEGILLAVYPEAAQRTKNRAAADGHSPSRARIEAVKALLE